MKKNRKINHQRPPRGQKRPLGSVQCLVCRKRFLTLASHLQTHGLSAVEYRNQFGPDAATECHEVWVKSVHGGDEGNERLRRLGYKHRTPRRFFRDPKWDQGCAPRTNETQDAGKALAESGEPQAVQGVAANAA